MSSIVDAENSAVAAGGGASCGPTGVRPAIPRIPLGELTQTILDSGISPRGPETCRDEADDLLFQRQFERASSDYEEAIGLCKGEGSIAQG